MSGNPVFSILFNLYCDARRLPNLLVDGVQLLLQHHGQRLCVGVAAGWEQVHGAEQRFPVVVIDVRHLCVALEVVTSQNPELLWAPFVLPQWFSLQRNSTCMKTKLLHLRLVYIFSNRWSYLGFTQTHSTSPRPADHLGGAVMVRLGLSQRSQREPKLSWRVQMRPEKQLL